jgi:uncharacterized membrane protein YuzA (DUF378 family)
MNFTDRGVRLSSIDWIALALVIIGALNWGLIGIGMFVDANWNLVDILLGWAPDIEALVYILVGLAALYVFYLTYQLSVAEARTTSARAD